MPVCRNLLKNGVCKDLDCPYKHTTDEIKECNMYKLGFCIYGPAVSSCLMLPMLVCMNSLSGNAFTFFTSHTPTLPAILFVQCRYKHTRLNGPPPDPTTVEAAKPREFRNITVVANQANQGISQGGVRRYRAPENQNQLMLEGGSRSRGGNSHPFGSGANASALGPKLPSMRMGA